MNALRLERITSSEAFRALVETASHLVLAMDTNGLVRIASPASRRLLHTEPVEIEGRTALDFVHPEDRDRLRAGFRSLVEGKAERLRTRFRGRLPDGAWRPLSVTARVIPGPSGAPLVVAAVCDVRTNPNEDSVEGAAKETFRAIVDSSPLAIITLSAKGRVRSWNAAAEAVYGWAWSEAIHRPLTFLGAGVEDRELDLVRRTLAGALTSNQEMRQRKRDGSPVYVSVSTAPLRNASAEVTGVLWMAADVTARRQGEETIAEQTRLLDSAEDAILVRGTNERLLYFNQAAVKLYGYGREGLPRVDTQDLVVADDLAKFEEARKTLALRGAWEGELRQRTRDGRTICVHSRWSLVRDAGGFPRGRMVVNRDVTAQKEMETHLRRTQRMESLGTLASGIAHDLNNILAPILMAVEMLRLHSTDEHDRQLLGTLEQSVHRGGDIVHQMLAFARGSEGQRIPLQLRHVVREIETILRDTFPPNIVISIDIPRTLPLVLADATQIHQVLVNLCVNARDVLSQGGTIGISARVEELDEHRAREGSAGPGRYIVLAVADDGPGISAEIKDRIFEPFFTTKEHGKGTGLGLSTVLSIARGHGGFVTCESEPGKGARFEVFFPTTANLESARADEPAPAIPLGAGETILVIDDDQSILLIIRQILESYEYKVLSAHDGTSALKAFRDAPRGLVRLVLTDMSMPGMGGPEAVQGLRKLDPSLPVILMSGLPPAGDEPEVERLSVQGVVGKPFKSEELLMLIRETIDHAPVNGAK